MTLLTAERISKKFDDQIILASVSFTLASADHIALVGKNGIGKTTLFEIIAGRIEADEGTINRSRSCRVDYVEQEKSDHFDATLFEFVCGARRDLLDMHGEMVRLQEQLAALPHDGALLNRLGSLQSRFELDGGFAFEDEVKIILSGLGFDVNRHSERLRNFSGGEKNRAGLARLLAGSGNLVLLDEPTNHLDIESTRWLEQYLLGAGRAYIVVSHDRAFLSAVADKVWEMTFGRIELYHGGVTAYLKERAERHRLHQHHYRHQQQEIQRLEGFVRKHMAGQKTKQAQSKLKYLNRMKRIPPPRTEKAGMSVRMNSSRRSFAHVISVEQATVGYGSVPVIAGVTFDLYRGDRVGLVGRNGSGKTTLLKSLIGELAPMEGGIRLGANVDVVYFDQELSDLSEEQSVLESIWEVEPSAEVHAMRSFIARFGFTGDDALKPVAALSGGEKTKLVLARILYHPANLLILDEPTNHLDLDSREALENALLDYNGSCLIVSHDRYFLDRVVNRILHLSDGRLTSYDGNYSYFAEKTGSAESKQERGSKPRPASYTEFKEKSRQRSRLKKQIQSTRSRIDDLERELSQVSEELHGTIDKTDWERLQQSTARKKELEEELLTAYSTLEELEASDPD